MKKNLRFIIPLAAFAILFLIFGIMYLISINSDNSSEDITETTDTSTQSTSAPTEVNDKYIIGIMQFDNTQEYSDVYDGFIDALRQRGLTEEINVEYIYENADGDSEKCVEIAQSMVEKNVDLIFAISEDNAVAAYEATKDIPIVFGAVTDPENAGLIETNEAPGSNVTGVSDNSPSIEQMDLVKSLFPNASTVSTVYNELDESSVTQISLAESQAETNGISFEKHGISEYSDIESLIKDIVEETDVIYIPYDELLLDKISVIINIAYENDIPVIGGNETMVINGCSAAYGIDYPDVGKQSALMVLEILQNGGNPAEMPVRYLNKLILYINSEAKEKFNFEISKNMEDKTVFISTEKTEE